MLEPAQSPVQAGGTEWRHLGELGVASQILCVNEMLHLTSPRSPLAATSFSPDVGGSSKGDSCASSKGDTEKTRIPEGFDVSSALEWAQTHRQSMTAATTASKTKHWGRGARRRTKPEPKNFDRREPERRLTGSLPARFNSLLNATRGVC